MKKKATILVTLLMTLVLCLSACGSELNASTPDESESVTAASVKETIQKAAPDVVPSAKVPVPNENEDSNNINQKIEDIGMETPTPKEPLEVEVPTSFEVENETIIIAAVTETPCDKTVYTNTDSNLRTQPNTKGDKVATVPKGTALHVTATCENGWCRVDYNGSVCYISGKLVGEDPVVNEVKVEATTDNGANTNSNATVSSATTDGTTRTFSNGQTFVARGKTPGGRTIWYMSDDNGTWPDYMINAYDATGVTDDMSDYDKAVAINNYICRVVDYAYENGVEDKAAYSACLTYGKAICTGYAHAFDCLCTIAGVYSNQVGGLSDGGAHSWNYVLIGDTKYWVDVTYNDTSNNAYLMSTSELPGHIVNYEN